MAIVKIGLNFALLQRYKRFIKTDACLNYALSKMHFCYKPSAGAKKAQSSWDIIYDLEADFVFDEAR